MIRIILILGLALFSNLFASGYSVELSTGYVWNMKEDIVNRVGGYPTMTWNNVQMETNPQREPYYYAIRISKWSDDDTAWELEHIHQKLYIEDSRYINSTTDVQKWEITDGFNFFLLNKAWKNTDYGAIFRLGGGTVIAHPDITIHDQTNHKAGHGAIPYGEGYHLCGFVVQASIQKYFDLTDNWFVGGELKATYAKASVPIYDGETDVQNRALHLDFGLGYRF